MPLIKPPEDWSDEDSGRYNGPPPKPGIYACVVNGMWRAKVKEGSENAGADLLLVSVKIADGKYKGATVLTNLLMIKTNAWKINQFLTALSGDGAEKKVAALKSWFWTIGYQISEGEPEKLGQRITKIGKKFEVDEKPIMVALKDGSYDGQTRPEVDRFVLALADDDDDDDDDDDGIGEFDAATTSNPAPETSSEPEEPAGPPAEDDGDDDDPWS